MTARKDFVTHFRSVLKNDRAIGKMTGITDMGDGFYKVPRPETKKEKDISWMWNFLWNLYVALSFPGKLISKIKW